MESSIEPHSFWGGCGTTKQFGEKVIVRERNAAGAEARTHSVGVSGPAKAVPLLQSFVGLCLGEFFLSL
jgi:hypothetical protein